MPTPSDDARVTRERFVEHRAIPEERFASAIDLWTALDPVRSRWTPGNARECGWIFRGQADSRWRLVPSAWRSSGSTAGVIREVVALVRAEHASRELDLWSAHCLAERRLLMDFVSVAERDGNELPPDTPRQGAGPLAHHEVATLAQHYRLPTALLDFTRDPRVAQFWAVDSDAPRGGGDLAIWAIRRDTIADVKQHEHARSRNRNLLAQDGVTVEMVMADHFVRATGRFPALEEVRAIPDDAIVKLVLSNEHAGELRRLLEVCGVTRARLTPGYYGVTQTVLSRYAP